MNLYYSFTLLCRIILVWLTVSFPYIAIDVIEIIGRNIWNAVELKKIRISRNSQEWEQDYDWKHRCRQKYRSCNDCNIELLDVIVESIHIYIGVSLTAGRIRQENWNAMSVFIVIVEWAGRMIGVKNGWGLAQLKKKKKNVLSSQRLIKTKLYH